MENKHLVFVYGTLRRNERNHHFLEAAACIAQQAWTSGLLFDANAGYPILQNQDTGIVYGELYEVDYEQLTQIDSLEGYNGRGENNDYDRIEKVIYTDKGKYIAYVYVMDANQIDSLERPIKSGDWKVYQFMKQSRLHYFAYGSCMDNARFKESNVDQHFQKVIGRGNLDGYTLTFTMKAIDGGRADIVEGDGMVEGKVYDIGQEAISYLYRREGVESGYYRPAIITVEIDDEAIKEAITFIVKDKQPETAPPVHYMEEIIRGGEGFLTAAYLQSLKTKFKKPNK